MRKLLNWILGMILLGCSCYSIPKNLKLPVKYKEGSPYVVERDDSRDINYYTLKNTKRYIDKAKKEAPKLLKAVEESEGKREKTLELVILGKRSYRRVQEDYILPKGTEGFYSIFHDFVVLKKWNPKTMIHEEIHLLDYRDGKRDLNEGKVSEKEREIFKKLE